MNMNKRIKNIFIILLIILSTEINAQNLTENGKNNILFKVIEKLETVYPFPEISEKTIAGLQSKISEGFFKKFDSSNEFATQVTSILEKYSNDKHLDLIFDPSLAKALLKETSSGNDYTKEEAKVEIWNNYGFKELKILDGNIGYLNLSVFFSIDYAREIADASMSYSKNCHALIIDLRQNGGGWGDMVVYLLSYLVDNKEPLLLDITKSTLDGSTDSTVVPVNISANKLTNIPIYILVSSTTASAAEAFTFYITHLNKFVTLVGKKTKGAENPVEHISLNENFVLQIPAWRRIYSKYSGSWEGVGIRPDIEIEPADALKAAHKMALEKLLTNTNDKTAIDKYQWALDGVSASYQNIDVNTIKEFAGSYDKIKIMYKNSKLYYQSGDGSAKLLIPISNNYYVVEGADYFRIKFIVSSGGIVLKQIFSFGTEKEYVKNE
jgi:C-terminal processing protease CtpA/Prc